MHTSVVDLTQLIDERLIWILPRCGRTMNTSYVGGSHYKSFWETPLILMWPGRLLAIYLSFKEAVIISPFRHCLKRSTCDFLEGDSTGKYFVQTTIDYKMCVCVCVCACVHARVRAWAPACVRASLRPCVRVCVCVDVLSCASQICVKAKLKDYLVRISDRAS